MQPTELAILGLVAWSLAITAMLVGERTIRVLFQGAAANGFDPHGADVDGFRQRLLRVHANNYENLALLLAVPVLAVAAERSGVTDALALWLVAARLAQGVVHLLSVSVFAVYLRVTFYSVQLGIIVYWITRLL